MIKWMGIEAENMNHRVDEEKVKIEDPKDLVGELSLMKAYEVAERLKGEGLVIGSDLVIALDKTIYGKAKDIKDGKRMLRELSGKTHSAWCGVAVVNIKTGESKMSVAETKVKMKELSEEMIDKYVKEVPVTDRAGAYGIQDEIKGFGSVVEKFDGGITTVIGFPLHYLENLLKEFGIGGKNTATSFLNN